jgi:hypothetical protein
MTRLEWAAVCVLVNMAACSERTPGEGPADVATDSEKGDAPSVGSDVKHDQSAPPDGNVLDAFEGGSTEDAREAGRADADPTPDLDAARADVEAGDARDASDEDSRVPPEDGTNDDAPPTLGCAWTQEGVSVTVHLPDGTTEDCFSFHPDAGPSPKFHRVIRGVVPYDLIGEGGSNSSVVINTCGGDAGCTFENAVIHVRSQLPFHIPVGAFVEAEYWVERPWACTSLLRISNLPEWNGRTNPVSNIAKTYVIAADGRDTSPITAATGITATPARLNCPVEAGTGCGGSPMAVDSYAYLFSADGAPPLTARMGQTISWTARGQILRSRNHRSYQSGLCDDYFNWSYSVVGD